MNSDLESVFALLFVLILLGVLIVPFVIFFVYVFFQNWKRNQIRKRLQDKYAQLIGQQHPIPVRYCDEPRFRAFFKIFPWNTAGLLFPTPQGMVFVGEHLNGTPIHMNFDPVNSAAQWIGKAPFPNGAVSWFLVSFQGQKHYFSSETGPFVFGSNNSTRAAYDVTIGNLTR